MGFVITIGDIVGLMFLAPASFFPFFRLFLAILHLPARQIACSIRSKTVARGRPKARHGPGSARRLELKQLGAIARAGGCPASRIGAESSLAGEFYPRRPAATGLRLGTALGVYKPRGEEAGVMHSPFLRQGRQEWLCHRRFRLLPRAAVHRVSALKESAEDRQECLSHLEREGHHG